MKNIFKITLLLFVALGMANCERDPIEKADHKLYPVLAITNVAVPEGLSDDANERHKELMPYGLNVYKEQSKVYRWKDDSHLAEFNMTGFDESASTETDYNVTFTLEWENTSVIDEVVNESTGETKQTEVKVPVSDSYVVKTNKATGLGTVVITRTVIGLTETVSYTIKMTPTQKFY